MSFLLMVFLVLVCLFEGYPEPLVWPTPGGSAVLTALAVAAVAFNAWRLAWLVRRHLGHDSAGRERVLRRYERARLYHQIGVLATFVVCLTVFGWGWAAGRFWGGGEPGGPSGSELLLLAPFLAAQLLSWAFFYDAERASQRAAQRLLEADPEARAWLLAEREVPPPCGGRAAYVLFQFRQKLGLVLIPVLLLVFQKELYRRLPHSWREWPGAANAGGILALALVFVTMPWVVRLVLGLKPLPAGPLRDLLLASGRRLRFRCSNILLWNTRSGMANAMVIGVVPWLRYVVFTDRLVEDFSPDEVEAVFGHEVGHVKHHHMLYYLGFLTASMAVLFLAMEKGEQLVRGLAGAKDSPAAVAWVSGLLSQDSGQVWGAVPVGACLVTYIFVVFGFLSRRCERQADVFGCRAVSCRLADCPGHADGAELSPAGRGLCPTGIRTFIRALEKVALVNGISRDKPGFLQSWQHSTIARRVEFLQRVLQDPGVERRFQRRVGLVKWAMFLVLGAVLGLLVWSRVGQRAPGDSPPAAHGNPRVAHGGRLPVAPADAR